MRHLLQSKYGGGDSTNAPAKTVTHDRVGHVTGAVTEGMEACQQDCQHSRGVARFHQPGWYLVPK